MSKRKTNFTESLQGNVYSYTQYIDRLTSLAISMFEWKGLPDSVDPRYLEMTLFLNGSAVYFNDDEIGNLALTCIPQGQFDVYGNPVKRRAYSKYNNYNRELDTTNSVIIWNNFLRTNSYLEVEIYAKRLYELDRIIDVNAKAQKTPVLVQGTEKQRLTVLNAYKEFDGNSPVIFGSENLDIKCLKVLKTDAPYVGDKLYTLKTQIWNEALTILGISNTNTIKKERLISDEVIRNEGGVIANRYSRLEARRQACVKINDMFGTNIECNFREDYRVADDTTMYAGSTGGREQDSIYLDKGNE